MATIKARATKAGSEEASEIALDYVSLKTVEDVIARYPAIPTAEAEAYLDPTVDFMPAAVLSAYKVGEESGFDIPSTPGERPVGVQVDSRQHGEQYANQFKDD